MFTVGRSWSVGSEYRYGLNSQEQDDEVYGNGNLNSALFWEYDTRLGRRWNLDPEPVTGISAYSCFLNNPILFVDIDGNAVDVDGLYKQDEKGNYLHPERIKEFELFASTTEGRKYILDHSQKGFLLIGVMIADLEIEAKEEGSASLEGIDVKFKIGILPTGYTSSVFVGKYTLVENGVDKGKSKATGARLEITFSFPEVVTSKIWDIGNELTLYGVDMMLHEVFLHGYYHEKRYMNGTNSIDGVNGADHNAYIYKKSPYYEKGWDNFNEAQIKLLNDVTPF